MASKNTAIQTARIFEAYVKYVWPWHRKLVSKSYSKRCQKCGASEKMLALEKDGMCTLCHSYNINRPQQEAAQQNLTSELNQILNSHQGRGKWQYDALCLFSGGKDSTYFIQRIRNEFPGLRMLAITIDNGFMSPIAKENIDEVLLKLKIDHIFIRPDPRFYIQLFRYCITHLNSDGGYGTLDFSDGEFLLDTARNIAAEKHIPLILCGYSKYQVQNGLKIHHFESPREQEFLNRTHTAGLALKDIFNEHDIKKWWHGSLWPKDQVARLLFPLYAWNLEETYIKQQVTSWGLSVRKEYSPMVTNHQLIPLIGVVDVHRFGYSSFEPEFCRMIREGKAQLHDWQPKFEFLEYISKTGLFVKPEVLRLLKILNLNMNDVGIHFS